MEHLRPITGLGAARAGGDDEETRRDVARLVEQGEQFEGTDVGFQRLRVVERLAGEIAIVEFLGEVDALFDVRDSAFEFEEGLEFLFQSGGLGGDGLCLVRSVAELGRAHGLREGGDFVFEGGDVKDTS